MVPSSLAAVTNNNSRTSTLVLYSISSSYLVAYYSVASTTVLANTPE